jgi:hypothetical protein
MGFGADKTIGKAVSLAVNNSILGVGSPDINSNDCFFHTPEFCCFVSCQSRALPRVKNSTLFYYFFLIYFISDKIITIKHTWGEIFHRFRKRESLADFADDAEGKKNSLYSVAIFCVICQPSFLIYDSLRPIYKLFTILIMESTIFEVLKFTNNPSFNPVTFK